MIEIMVHTPVTSRGMICSYLKDRIKEEGLSLKEEIKITSPHDYEDQEHGLDNWLENCIKNDTMPDIMLSHASDLTVLSTYDDVAKYFEPIFKDLYKKHPLIDKFSSFEDKDRYFYPLFLICMLMVYNKKNIDKSELNSSWKDLLNKKFKTVITSEFKPPTKITGSKILKENPELIDEFMNLDKVNSPIMIIKQLQSGMIDLGLSHTSFAITGNTSNIEINYPKEGIAGLPQVIMCKKGVSEKVIPIIEILLEKKLQDDLIKNGFFTLQKGSENNPEIEKHIKDWQGYREFTDEVKKFENYGK